MPEPLPLPDLPTQGEAMARWERIASSFAATRGQPWHEVLAWVRTRLGSPNGRRVLDAGAGNGRHALPLQEAGWEVTALDASRGLIRRAPRDLHRVQGSLAALPLRDDVFHGALCVAAVHCLPGRHLRLGALGELARVVRPGGRVLVTVWARDQPRFATLATPAGEGADVLVPWRAGEGGEVPRYYRLYARAELASDLVEAGFADVEVWGEDLTDVGRADNWFGTGTAPG